MPASIEEISTITAKGQTTVPKAIRRALGIDYGGRIAFRVDERGVTVHRADVDETDPTIDSFLTFLAADLKRHPERITALSPELAARVTALTDGIAIDFYETIDGDVDL